MTTERRKQLANLAAKIQKGATDQSTSALAGIVKELCEDTSTVNTRTVTESVVLKPLTEMSLFEQIFGRFR